MEHALPVKNTVLLFTNFCFASPLNLIIKTAIFISLSSMCSVDPGPVCFYKPRPTHNTVFFFWSDMHTLVLRDYTRMGIWSI